MALSTSSSDGSALELMTAPGRGRGMSTLVTTITQLCQYYWLIIGQLCHYYYSIMPLLLLHYAIIITPLCHYYYSIIICNIYWWFNAHNNITIPVHGSSTGHSPFYLPPPSQLIPPP